MNTFFFYILMGAIIFLFFWKVMREILRARSGIVKQTQDLSFYIPCKSRDLKKKRGLFFFFVLF